MAFPEVVADDRSGEARHDCADCEGMSARVGPKLFVDAERPEADEKVAAHRPGLQEEVRTARVPTDVEQARADDEKPEEDGTDVLKKLKRIHGCSPH